MEHTPTEKHTLLGEVAPTPARPVGGAAARRVGRLACIAAVTLAVVALRQTAVHRAPAASDLAAGSTRSSILEGGTSTPRGARGSDAELSSAPTYAPSASETYEPTLGGSPSFEPTFSHEARRATAADPVDAIPDDKWDEALFLLVDPK